MQRTIYIHVDNEMGGILYCSFSISSEMVHASQAETD